MATTALPGAFTGGAGTVNRLNGTGWYTLDANGGVARLGGPRAFPLGLHRDAETFAPARATIWPTGSRADAGTVVNAAKGRTATNALWLQDIWSADLAR